MKIFHQIAIVLLFMNVNAQKTIEIKIYFEVDGDTITESNRGHILHEKFQVLKSDKKIKHGKYIRFSKLIDIIEEGNYCEGKKCGIWESYSFDGFLITKYDHDLSRELEPELNFRKLYKYPFE